VDRQAAVGAAGLVIPVLWPLTIVAGFGVIRQAKLAGDVFSLLDGLMRQQYPDVQVNPAADTNTGTDAGQF
jgi:hypothetical protein